MKKMTINGEAHFSVLAHSFSVYSDDAYTLNYSADGINFTAWDAATPAGETLIVNGVAKGMYFYLEGNTTDAVITY